MPQPKKDPSTRRRRNVASTAATLTDGGPARKAPELPKRPDGSPWHPAVVEMWADVWASPMAKEYHPSDFHQLVILALLTHDVHTAETPTARRNAAAELRHHRASFGLTPYDRRRLEWTIEVAEEAQDRGRSRRSRTGGQVQAPAPSTSKDPRAALKVVSS